MNVISFRNYTCYYKQKKSFVSALEHINLSISQGELVAVIGESGGGKTTLLRSCLGCIKYFEGDLFINGQKVETVSTKNENYAYVSQELSLYPHLTVFDNIAFPLRIINTPFEEIKCRITALADELGISVLLTRLPKHLSVGQQQRVAIARALIKNPSILYFDEPFANLDPALHSELSQLIKKIHHDLRPTILFVTHDIDEALMLADKIAIIHEGRLTDYDTPKNILQNSNSGLILGYLNKNNRC